jgi:hypothetical protein
VLDPACSWLSKLPSPSVVGLGTLPNPFLKHVYFFLLEMLKGEGL